MAKKILAGAGLGILFLVLGSGLVLADGPAITLINPLSCPDLNCVATKLAGFLQTIGFAIAVIMVLVGAFQMMTSAGDPEKFSTGRKTILYAAIGTGVLIIAGGIVGIIQSLFK